MGRTPLFIGGAAVVVVLAIIVGYFALRGPGDQPPDGGDLTTQVIPKETPPPSITTTEVKPDSDFSKPDLDIPYFDFDRAYIRPDAARSLTGNVKWFKDHPTARIRLEGHCDVRGTREYNYALGQRRATAVKNWLIRKGVSNALETISYGKDRVVAYGMTDSDHQKNRRVEFKVVN